MKIEKLLLIKLCVEKLVQQQAVLLRLIMDRYSIEALQAEQNAVLDVINQIGEVVKEIENTEAILKNLVLDPELETDAIADMFLASKFSKDDKDDKDEDDENNNNTYSYNASYGKRPRP